MAKRRFNLKNEAIVATILASTVAMTACTNKETKEFKKFMELGKYEKASDYLSKNDDKIKYENVVGDVEAAVETTYNDFIEDEITSEEAISSLTFLQAMADDELVGDIQTKIDTVGKIAESRENYKKAEEQFEIAYYSVAEEYYALVIPEDTKYYEKAQKKIKECQTAYIDAVISGADEWAENGDYAQAIANLKIELDVVTDKSKLEEKINEYQTGLKEQYVTYTENNYIPYNDYAGAIAYLQEKTAEFADEKIFDDKIAEYTESYKDYLIKYTEDNYIPSSNYSGAISYLTERASNFDDATIFDDKLNEYREAYLPIVLEKADTDYISDDKNNYQGAINYLKDQSQYFSDTTEIDAKLEEYRTAYLESILDYCKTTYADNQNYANAITYLVGQRDYFDDTTEIDAELQRYRDIYLALVLDKAKTDYADKGNFESAMNYLEGQKAYFEDVTAIDEQIVEYKDVNFASEGATATEYYENQNFTGAMLELNRLATKYEGLQTYDDLRASAEEAYLGYVIPLIDAKIADGNTGAAYAICENALGLLPESETLKSKLESLSDNVPMLLSEITLASSDYFSRYNNFNSSDYFIRDVKGNSYVPGNLYVMSISRGWGDEDGYAKLYANKEYATFGGTLAAAEGTEAGDVIFEVYVDEELVESITFNNESDPVEFSIDIPDSEWIELKIVYPEDASATPSAKAILSNCYFSK